MHLITGILDHFPSLASLGYAIGLTEHVDLSIPNPLVEIENVILAVQAVELRRLSAFAFAASAVAFAESGMPGFVPTQFGVGPEASLPAVALALVVPLIVALVVLVELAFLDTVVDTQVVAMAVPMVDIAVVVLAWPWQLLFVLPL